MERNMARWLKSYWIWLVIVGVTGVYAPLTGRTEKGEVNQKELGTLIEVIDLIQKQSLEPPNMNLVTRASIAGMLSALDPHSRYMDENEFRAMRDEQRGSFYGIGSEIKQHPDGIVVVSTIQGGPSEKAGIRKRDVIREINGKPIENWTVNDAAQKLKGENGTVVEVTIQRTGVTKPFRVSIVRSEITSNSVFHIFMINATTGFIAIKDFSETTAEEFRLAIRQLKSQGMKYLILDLRDNGGGLLNAALGICQQILGPNELIVTQKGRNSKDVIENRTSANSIMDPFPMVVLINRNSASASEIVAGSIQDHDRGLVVGQTSWGKGLVQVVMAIGRTHGLVLTTTRYYTPSGRCIQRDYSRCIDDYLLPEDENEESTQHSGPKFKTDLNRIVYGNGGVTPDYVVSRNKPNSFVFNLSSKYDAFSKFAMQEKEKHTIKPQQVVNNAIMKRFKIWLNEQEIEYREIDWSDPKNQADIRNCITIEMQRLVYNADAAFRLQSKCDPQIRKALEVMPKAEALLKQKIAVNNRNPISDATGN